MITEPVLPPLKDRHKQELFIGDRVVCIGLFDWTPPGHNHGTIVALDVKNVYQVGGHVLIEFPDGTGKHWCYHPEHLVKLLG